MKLIYQQAAAKCSLTTCLLACRSLLPNSGHNSGIVRVTVEIMAVMADSNYKSPFQSKCQALYFYFKPQKNVIFHSCTELRP